jgi:hypothetical protein
MGSDKTRALMAFAKFAIAAAAGYAIYYVWNDTRIGLDEWYVAYAAGVVSAIMVFILLSKLNKGGD